METPLRTAPPKDGTPKDDIPSVNKIKNIIFSQLHSRIVMIVTWTKNKLIPVLFT